ncbi:hypothetical protein E1281_34570 [Actinomadura sp. KC345]|uniref:hypothetical protein n=1 Tax=Actinomadura sp. KC345 TaxID=2530371 RepID=UPI00104B4D60|nr:hypothetical protein [Actinomadura sp. KC345]TDC44014.1 hypothetical protein E1281_34570 [Actinomadura sp. KC345]
MILFSSVAMRTGDLEGAAEELTKLLTLDPALRLTAVTCCLADLDRRLNGSSLQGCALAVQLRRQIRDFKADA